MGFTPHTPADRQRMVERIGVKSIDELFSSIPPGLRLGRPLDLPAPLSEYEAIAALRERAALNRGIESVVCFAGAGAYDHTSPAVVDAIISRSEFLTAYTPYQAEVSQGTLESIYEFQSLVCRLTAMDVANASMYDAGSAVAEAAQMAQNITRRDRILVAESVHPAHVEVIRTYARGLGIPVETVGLRDGVTDLEKLRSAAGGPGRPAAAPSARREEELRQDSGTDSRRAAPGIAAVVVQHPNFFGSIEPMPGIAELARAAGALLIAVVDPVSLGVLAPPGAYGADIAVAEGQAFGLPLSYGGPYLGMLATRLQYVRQLPGRLVGRTTDVEGRTGYVLALQTREQHIRRERASSNICTNQALMALAASVCMAWFGREGLAELGRQCLSRARHLAGLISGIPGFKIENSHPFFKEFTVATPVPAREVIARGLDRGILAGVDLGRFRPEWNNRLLVAVTENRSREQLDSYARFLREEFGARQ
ncbi:MAG: glycine dehydrogenase [bacterium]